MAQALVRFLSAQCSERDGRRQPFFAGVFGIFGHGNVAGVGQALDQMRDRIRYYQCRNEQAMVHTAAAFAKMSNRLRTLACTTSIGPGATNMVTGAAGATINRLPVLLLPGDIFANRAPAPVLQQLESSQTQDVSVNDCFRPVSRYWDRIYRPEQLLTSLPEAMRVLTSPAETGAVTLALPQDTQTEAFDYPDAFFDQRVVDRAAAARRCAGDRARGGRHSSEPRTADHRRRRRALQRGVPRPCGSFAEATGIAVCGDAGREERDRRGITRLPLGAIGVTGSLAANHFAREADLVIAIGTRLGDFTTMSNTAFQNPDVRFVAINVCELDAFKHGAIPIVADARAALEELTDAAARISRPAPTTATALEAPAQRWSAEVDRIYGTASRGPFAQGESIGTVNAFARPQDVVVCAAGSLPGDLHKLWRAREPNTYHLEYGYSCMGYEIAGGLGVKMADPSRDVFVMVGDGSFLMMAQEIVTSVQEGYKLIIVLLDSCGLREHWRLVAIDRVGRLRHAVRLRRAGRSGRECRVARRDRVSRQRSRRASTRRCSRREPRIAPRVIYARVDPLQGVPGYDSWWDVPVAEVSEQPAVQHGARRLGRTPESQAALVA